MVLGLIFYYIIANSSVPEKKPALQLKRLKFIFYFQIYFSSIKTTNQCVKTEDKIIKTFFIYASKTKI